MIKKVIHKHSTTCFLLMAIVSLVGIGVYLSPQTSFGITLNIVGNEVYIVEEGGPYVIYNVGTGVSFGGGGNHDPNELVGVVGGPGNYSVIETTGDGVCEDEGFNYTQCKASAYFVGESIFVVGSSGGVSSAGGGSGGGSVSNNTPTVTISKPDRNTKNIKGSVVIEYEAKDSDDDPSRGGSFGLADDPVTIYYLRGSRLQDKILIAKDLPAKGDYEWDVSELPEGNVYIVVEAIDKAGQKQQELSNQLVIDNSAPIFKLTITPEATRGEPVEILIEPSEELFGLPDLFVIQRGHDPVKVKIKTLDDGTFSGTYEPVPGFDGLAVLDVSGRDLNRNLGTTTSSGGFFSVGVEPPPKPVIISPLDQEVVTTSAIDVVGGNARNDLNLSLVVNNKETYSTTPDADGNFKFVGVLVDKTFNKGKNFLRLIARDLAGNQTEVPLTVKFNIEPDINFISPIAGQILTGSSSLQVASSDDNGDQLVYSFELARGDSSVFSSVIRNTLNSTYRFDSTLFADGDYVARVAVDDGFGKSYATSSTFTIRNYLPAISFVGGNTQIVNTKSTLLKGSVESSSVPTGDPKNPTIVKYSVRKVEYSLDEGVSWTSVSGGTNNFTINLNTTLEKSYSVLVRALDERGFYGQAKALVIADFGPPVAAIIDSPVDGEVFSNKEDQNKNLAGVQVTLTGRAEPESTVVAVASGLEVSTEVNKSGQFVLPDVSLTKHGANTVSVTVTDLAGNKSPAKTLTLQSNNRPEIKFISPRSGRGLGSNTKIVWESRDQDLDNVDTTALKIKPVGGKSFNIIAENITGDEYDWSLPSGLTSGEYELVVEVTDGISKNTASVLIAIDRVPPTVSDFKLNESVFTTAAAIRGRGVGQDDLSGIEFAEYSFTGDKWQAADILGGFLTKKASFGFVSQSGLLDGEYDVKARVIDGAGNVSEEASAKLLVDTTPPRVGSISFEQSKSFLLPNDNGSFLAGADASLVFTVSLEADTVSATATIGSSVLPLNQGQNNLWQSSFKVVGGGENDILIEAEDALGHRTLSQKVGLLKIVPSGKVWYEGADGEPQLLPGAEIEVWVFNDKTNELYLWQGASFGGVNPVIVGADGRYSLSLPTGTYELRISNPGFERLRTERFVLDRPTLVNDDFKMVERFGFIGWLKNLIN